MRLYAIPVSTYSAKVRIALAVKGIDYEMVPPPGGYSTPTYRKIVPLGTIPALEDGDFRLSESDVLIEYLEETHPEPALVPGSAKDRALMNEAISLINSYGYGALVGVAGYHLFPDFIGGQNDEARAQCIEKSKTLLSLLMENKGEAKWLAGDQISLGDYFLAPIMFYVSLTPDADVLLEVPGVSEWWAAIQDVETFKATEPDLG